MKSAILPIYFSDHFRVDPNQLDEHGAFNVSLVTDLPLFIDPFLLFNSEKEIHRQLHEEMIRYLRFLRDQSVEGSLEPGLIARWCRFPEVKQTWLGFSETGNNGRGLGGKFASALAANFELLFRDFGDERITKGSHLEKLCLVSRGVGRDMISDFTTNLIKGYLCEYTETFAKKHIETAHLREFSVDRVAFNYDTRSWVTRRFTLPKYERDYVLLTPADILSKDDTWISKDGFLHDFESIPDAIPSEQLRAQINDYFNSQLPPNKTPSDEERHNAIQRTVFKFPSIYDYYIKSREDRGDEALARQTLEVQEVYNRFVEQARELRRLLGEHTAFFNIAVSTIEDARTRALYLKDIIENKGGWRLFWYGEEPFRREKDLQVLYRLTWHGTVHDISREVDDGRGPVDFKVSQGGRDKTLVEMKLASNSGLRRNLERQAEIYQAASDAKAALKVILFFSPDEEAKVSRILEELKLSDCPSIILIDGRRDNKPSGSKA
jgi:hypothetical protein